MLRRTTPDGGRLDNAALSSWRGRLPHHSSSAGLLFVIVFVLLFARLSGCLGAIP
jgi:hypothetical protein